MLGGKMKIIEKITIFVFLLWLMFMLYLASGGMYKYYHVSGAQWRINKITGTVSMYDWRSGRWKSGKLGHE